MNDEEDWSAWKNYILTASHILAGADTDLQSKAGMSLSDFDVLVTLYSAPDHQLSMSCLKATALVTTSGISRSVSRLGARGLLTKENAEHDRRQVTLTLTPEGVEVYRKVAPRHYAYVRENFFDFLSIKDQRALALALTHLSDHVLEH